MNKFDGLDIVLIESKENVNVEKPAKKSFFGVFALLICCVAVAVLAVFNMLSPVKNFLQTEYDYSKKDINLPIISASVAPTRLTIKMPFASSITESAGEIYLTPYDACIAKAGAEGTVSEVNAESGNRTISIKLNNGCVIKYSGLTYAGVKEGCAVSENSPVGLAESSVKVSAYFGEIRLALTMGANGEITWQN